MIIAVDNRKSSEYLAWAKLHPKGRFNLTVSGLMNHPLANLPVKLEDLEITGSGYGYPPLQQAMAEHCGVPEECIVAGLGTAGANMLAMSALLDPGDEILVEFPVYEPVLAVARFLGATINRFPRLAEDGFALDPREIERNITPRTRLIAITNLHNPSSALIPEDTLRRVGEIAQSVGATVMVDEIYLEALFENAPRSAFHLPGPFVVTNSLTKVYGLSGLRCGWVLAPPDLVKRMWALTDVFYGMVPHAAERLSVIAFAHLDQLRQYSKALLTTNRGILNEFLARRPDLDARPLEAGTVVFPRLRHGSVDELFRLMRDKYDTSIVPGSFFEMPAHFRIGISGDTEELREGLQRLGAALDELK